LRTPRRCRGFYSAAACPPARVPIAFHAPKFTLSRTNLTPPSQNALAGLGLMLAAEVIWDVGVLVRVPFYLAEFPAVSLVGGGAYHLIGKTREQ